MSRPARQSPKSASISVRGIVQGVGFRPFVYGLAVKHGLKGFVYNTSEDVKIEVEGAADEVRLFEQELRIKAPPLANIEEITVRYHAPRGYENFEIHPSQAQSGKYQLISPDIATCRPCLEELLNPADRRYHYPFTNCTNCGPRFTIIEDMPYDRAKTTMRGFKMCPECRAEYDDPLDRRFHAQPNACPRCGPHVELVDDCGKLVTGKDRIGAAGRLLKEGKIVAVKGLGGFLLACDATNGEAVRTLRERKKRPSKPLAVMVTNADEARCHCYVSPEEEKLLTSPQSPIVLMRWREDSSVCHEVAPNLRFLGVMLPYTPLHHILLRNTGRPLVMTSGNLSEEPIARDNDEALRRLSGIADYFLMHNRDIYSRYDDSVAMVERGTPQLVRRARSYAPYPVRLPFRARQLLACGAEDKNTFCLTRDSYAFVSQHIGDMENMETLEHFERTIALYKRLFHVEPEAIAYDLHPDYLPTKYALELGQSGMKLVGVQHHHAHIAGCMADNALEGPVIGVAFDGTGMGTDGNIWGGEFLVVDYRGFRRAGHLEYLPLPGGPAAIRRPHRIAIGYVLALLGEDALNDLVASPDGSGTKRPSASRIGYVSPAEIEIIRRQIEKRINSPLTSSMGRLFDAISALLGIRGEIDYEGQAAVELEMAAYAAVTAGSPSAKNDKAIAETGEAYPYGIVENNEIRIVRLRDLLSAVIEDLRRDIPLSEISLRFHNTIARMINDMCRAISGETGITQVALSGGVFQNRLLLRKTVGLLERSGVRVLTHKQVPCNDGGVSLGQAVIASLAP
jgi:hydrogenase maturation protein HypF